MDDIEFKTQVSDLSKQSLEWFAASIIGVILADGQIDRSEIGFMMKVMKVLDDDGAIERLKKYIRFQTVPPIGPPPSDLNRKVAMTIIVDLVRVAVADQKFSPLEKKYIRKIAANLGFNDEEYEKLVDYGFQTV